MSNPFYNTKAVHLNNFEIVNYWVDINNIDTDEIKNRFLKKFKNIKWKLPNNILKLKDYQYQYQELNKIFEKESFLKVVEPENPRPFIILGGKGSGKTHILRYFSYKSRKALANKNGISIIKQIQKDKFFSILLELGNFQFERFQNSKLETSVWNEWFFYYLNIILTKSFLELIIDLQKNGLNDFDKIKIANISKEFLFNEDDIFDSIEEIYKLIKKENKKIDKAFSRIRTGIVNTVEGIEPLFDTRETRFLDIAYYITKASETLKDMRVMFFLDQFEDLSSDHQKFINTIIRHPKHVDTISIRIMGRLYAIKNEDTFSDTEKILGAEVTKKFLETIMSSSTSYQKFIILLIQKRLQEEISDDQIKRSFETNNINEVINKIKKKHTGSEERVYFKKLNDQLIQYQNNLNLQDSDIPLILKNLYFNDSPIKEKENIWLLYQAWAKGENIVNRSIDIHKSLSKEGKDLHKNETLCHLKSNFLFQLAKDYSFPLYNCGFNIILRLSSSNPRNFMDIINEMYEQARFNSEKMFQEDYPLSCKTQDQAIKQVSDSFWEDAIIDIKDFHIIKMVRRLNNFFKAIRISDKPTEKTLIAFSYKGELQESAQNILENAVNHMFLKLKKNAKKEKNRSGEMLDIYYTTPILTVKWDLPSTIGGVFQFSSNDINILCLGDDDEWKKIHTMYLKRYNVPFQKKELEKPVIKKELEKNHTPSLFGDF